MPVGQHTDQDDDDIDPLGLYRDTGPVTGLHLCTANSLGLHLQLLRLGRLPIERHTDQDGDAIDSCRLYRDTSPVTVLHLCSAGQCLHLVYLLGLGKLALTVRRPGRC